MAAIIGHVTVDLLVRASSENEPILLGTVDLPLHVQLVGGHMGRIVIDPAEVRASLARALADADEAHHECTPCACGIGDDHCAQNCPNA